MHICQHICIDIYIYIYILAYISIYAYIYAYMLTYTIYGSIYAYILPYMHIWEMATGSKNLFKTKKIFKTKKNCNFYLFWRKMYGNLSKDLWSGWRLDHFTRSECVPNLRNFLGICLSFLTWSTNFLGIYMNWYEVPWSTNFKLGIK